MHLAKLVTAHAAFAALQGCTLARTIVHNGADLDDHRIFANRTVPASGSPSPLRPLARVPAFIARLRVPDGHGAEQALESYLDQTRTAAFVVMRDDRVVYERYSRGFDGESLLNSFSIAKSVVATLVGIAVSEGRLHLDHAVQSYRPDFAGTPYGPVTLRRLLSMTSGLADAPSFLPGRAQYYYGDDLRAVVAHAVAAERDGAGWRYSEADVQMLGFVLEAATGMPVSSYLAEKLWKPLGMESPALWALDREGGMEKAFCCMSARARDFARLGRLFLDAGRWNGRQVVPADWAERRVLAGIRTDDGYLHHHLWWEPPGDEGDFYAYGHNGQYLYVNPASRVVIVKFSETMRQDPVPMFRAISATLREPRHIAEIERIEAATFARRTPVAHFDAADLP
jgi:CubicO group peptidase (beta-lactamase class C family)